MSKKTEVVSVSREEFERLQLLASKATQTRNITPGFEEMTPDSYVNKAGVLVSDLAHGVRTLANGSQIEYKISPNGWVTVLYDFVPPQRGRSPRPGKGGYLNRLRGYAEYERSKEYLVDLAWCKANGAKDAPAGA